MRASRIVSLVSVIALSALAGCSADATDDAATESDDVTSKKIKELSFSLFDTQDKNPETMTVTFSGSSKPTTLTRCHWHWTDLDEETFHTPRRAMVCRDDKLEVIVESTYASKTGEKWTRTARTRSPGGGQQLFTCTETTRVEAKESWDQKTDHLCAPVATIDAYSKELYTWLDAPVIEKYPTRTPFLPTLWAKSPPETWSKYAAQFEKAMPVGEYVGFGATSSTKCKVTVAKEGDGFKVSVHGLDASGAETRLRAQVVVSSAMTFGAMRADKVDQEFSSKARPASVLVANSETETTTKDYTQKNLRVVRFDDAPTSVEAGTSAIAIDDNYCQRLSPSIPVW